MTHPPTEEWAHRCFAAPPTVQKGLTLAEVDEELEKLGKLCDEVYGTAIASKNDFVAGPSSGSKPNKVTKPKAKKAKFPIEEIIARLTQAAQHDAEARKILEKIWHGP
ncbi:hypothetical protein NEUTE1DRAFT_34714 [Neurospora tetrasperma FGSC 2508]|uniref:Uncharacterized protein n=1 Tax=Neurospora tetrasperma (strain FGSC 2508 / ATCC MYA-4615 / P0657) TaxID=510951 RepID=F8MCX0_NEUT8|nr:uncharacterized protein NEUTE1DRAFT_34714 [Neurospora tetrasperma FGSC 2508]EGO61368.1 hypothetical protein NEUTE1DRAFT_34714 [Neurospora tetrasperma FGSC 2508]EGZ74609.1 hypothetical protein NEUTE2DRAFT_57086 [Neurospora tetrasperma FGSC 2509]